MRRKSKITVKSQRDLKYMKHACALTAKTLDAAAKIIKPGISTLEIDNFIIDFTFKNNAIPAFLNYCGYPAASCISINDEVIHGIPSNKKIIRSGDIVSIDFGIKYKGFYGDAARTFAIGNVSSDKINLINTAEIAFYEACKILKPGIHIGDISNKIQSISEAAGFGVVRAFVGHGIGSNLHEPPQIPNFGEKGTGPIIPEGATLAIEPMITMGRYDVHTLDDGWTVVTNDGLPSSHYENTVLVTKNGCEILTKFD